MALSEFEQKRFSKIVEQFLLKRRPPAYMRDKLDIGCRLEGQSIEIFDIRPVWNNPAKKMESPIAKATYVKSNDNGKCTG